MTVNEHQARSVSGAEYALWSIAVVIGGLFVLPGLGAVVGGVLGFTRFRELDTVPRWGLLAVGLALVVVQLVGLAAGGSSGTVGPVSPVG